MEEQTRAQNWLANGNLRLAVIAAALVLILVGTQLGGGDTPDAALNTGASDSTADFSLLNDETAAANAPSPVISPTPIPTLTPEPAPAPEPLRATETATDEAPTSDAPVVGTTLAAGAGNGALVVPATGTGIAAVGLDPMVTAETTTAETDRTGCDLPEDAPAETSPAPQTSPAAATTTAAPAAEVATPATDANWFNDTFQAPSADWQPLSGSWTVDGGAYVQTDATGYDFITQLSRRPPSEFRVALDINAPELLNAGVILGQPDAGTRAGATIVDFTEDGTFLRWGVYEPGTGQYRYIGGAALVDFDPSGTVRLGIERRTERTYLLVNGREVAAIDAIPEGRIGLVTSVSSAAFSNFTIEELGQ